MQCPHCLQHFHEKWTFRELIRAKVRKGPRDEIMWGAGATVCAACGQAIICLGEVTYLVEKGGVGSYVPQPNTFFRTYPKGISRPPIPSEVPPEFGEDYSEACLVLNDSEKASAALSRRCLQHILREKAGAKHADLAREIQEVLDSKELPGHLATDLDAIRNVGNFAAHPLKATNTGEIIDVEPHEAEWLLNVLEGLFDFYFVQPARAQAKRDALNAKLQSAGKPPMKQPSSG